MNVQTMRSLRRYHHYIGVFFAPAIVLFSISGALQTFRLQQVSGYGSKPPAAFVWLASVHKDQALPDPEPEKPIDAPKHESRPKEAKPAEQPPRSSAAAILALKIFVTLLSIGLLVSAVLGVIIALNTRATRTVSVFMLVAGSVLPIALLYA